MNGETEELVRLQNRVRRLAQMTLKPSLSPGISLGGRSSQKVQATEIHLPSFIDEPRQKALDSKTPEAIEAMADRVQSEMQAAYARINILKNQFKQKLKPDHNKSTPVRL